MMTTTNEPTIEEQLEAVREFFKQPQTWSPHTTAADAVGLAAWCYANVEVAEPILVGVDECGGIYESAVQVAIDNVHGHVLTTELHSGDVVHAFCTAVVRAAYQNTLNRQQHVQS